MQKNDDHRKHTCLKLGAAAALMVGILAWQQPFLTPAVAAPAVALASPAVDLPAGTAKSATLVLSGGCFWGVQGVFQHVRGVTSAVAGYAGGQAGTAHYDDVSMGTTGHAEAVQITYDPSEVSFGKLLQIFFAIAHDPTELNRQGPDTGTQYRSAILPRIRNSIKSRRRTLPRSTPAMYSGSSSPRASRMAPGSIRPKTITRIT